MKITIACDVLGEENNGTTIAAMNLIRFLKKRGHEVRVVCPDEDRRGEAGFFVVPQLNVGPLNRYVRKVGVSIAVSDDGILNRALRDVDAVHIMTPFFLGKAALDHARKAGIPVTAGESYDFSFWMRADEIAASGAKVTVSLTGMAGNALCAEPLEIRV